MINLIITIFGVLLVIAGFYSMSFGFSTPPNLSLFILGLIAAVGGLILVIVSAGNIQLTTKPAYKPSKTAPSTKTKPRPKPRPVKVTKKVPEAERKTKALETVEKTIKPKPRIKKPKKAERPEITPKPKEETIENKPVIGSSAAPKEVAKPPEFESEPETSEAPAKEPDIREPITTPEKTLGEIEEPQAAPEIKRPDLTKLKPKTTEETDKEYVKKRLNRLKENYIQNAKDVESIIDERLDTFKGTLGKLKSESQEPGIIWSFDAGEVQEALTDTISKADERILMMYPWIRNIDITVLKKFMETKSRIIVQEASLDDDASVELLKLLIDNKVEVRTMPHVHTVAVVADQDDGLIISTDPIYESFDVGVVYRDQKSIEEIERLFEDAWNISQDVDLEIKK